MAAKLFLIEYSKQNPKPNGVAAAIYEDYRVMQDPLDAPLMGSNTIQGPKTERRRRSVGIETGHQLSRTISVDSG